MSFVFRNPALAPLFVAVGAGVVGATGFGAYYLGTNPDVVLNKRSTPQPWMNVRQDQQIKLYTPKENSAFWASRQGMAHPSSIYSTAKEKVQEIKGRAQH